MNAALTIALAVAAGVVTQPTGPSAEHRHEYHRLRPGSAEAAESGEGPAFFQTPSNLLLPMMMTREGTILPVNDAQKFKASDRVHFAMPVDRREESEDWLRRQGWQPSPQ